MKRNSRSQRAEAHKSLPKKRRIASKAVLTSGTAAAGLKTKVARLTRELNEAREQQDASEEILQVISASAADYGPLFIFASKLPMRSRRRIDHVRRAQCSSGGDLVSTLLVCTRKVRNLRRICCNAIFRLMALSGSRAVSASSPLCNE
jgi:hypothetical protein